jgi:hypothetical protein
MKPHDALRKKLMAVESSLQPFYFLRDSRPTYLDQAKIICAAVMRANRPAGATAQKWEDFIQVATSLLQAQLISGANKTTNTTLHFSLKNLGVTDQTNKPIEITGKILRDWVQAGLDSHPLGKNITMRDAALISKGKIAVIYNKLRNAYYGNSTASNIVRLREAIELYAKEQNGTSNTENLITHGKLPNDIATAIKQEWSSYFEAVIPIDYTAWLKQRFKSVK